MMTRIRLALFGLVGACVLFGGYRGARYFLDTSYPEVVVAGIEPGGAYAGDVQCVLSGSDGYRVRNVSVWLDDGALVEKHPINRKNFEYMVPVATKKLVDGEHVLKVEVQDGSYRGQTTVHEISFFVDNVPLQSAFTSSDQVFKVFQGRTLRIQFQVNKPIREATVELFSQKFPCMQEDGGALIYECFVPVRVDEPASEYPFTVRLTDRVGNKGILEGKVDVVAFPFKNKQSMSVNKEKMREEELAGKSERLFDDEMKRVSQASQPQKLWKGAFYVPCDMKGISTEFGTSRISQERGHYSHNAVDLTAAPKSVVWAAHDGRVVIKDRYAHSGNTVVLDHGFGVLTMYFHLDSFADINVGDSVAKGKPVGTLGMTGYASGYHLHWELRIRNVPVDPMQWTTYKF